MAITTTYAFGLSADQLAKYFGISTWNAVVQLPPKSFTVNVYAFANGVIGNCILSGQPEWNSKPDEGFVIMLGVENGQYKLVTSYPSGKGPTIDTSTQIKAFQSTIGFPLPEVISTGDYILFGSPKEDRSAHSKLDDFESGFVLRVSKNENA
ncbi:MAG: hypothetical protein ACOYM3_18745 [Terrimicrobiaceae bacterium]